MPDVQLPPGVSRGASPNDRPGRWWDANLVRWRNGRLMPVGGWQRITKDPIGDKVRRLIAWRDNRDIKRTALGCDGHLYIYEGSVMTDITPADFAASFSGGLPKGYGIGGYGAEAFGTPRAQGSAAYLRASTWSLDTWGEDLMAVSSTDGRLLHWSPLSAASPAAAIPQAPTGNRAVITTEQRHVMLIGAGGNPRRVAWCSSEDYSDWDFANVANSAGFLELETSGLLVSAIEVRDGVLVFSDSDVWLMQYVGQPYIYGRQRVGSATSLMSPHTVVTVAGSAFWMGRNGFWRYEAGVCKPLECDISDLFATMDPTYSVLRAHAAFNGTFQEITWYYPSIGSTECDRYVTYNFAEGWWSWGKLDRTAALEADVNIYPLAAGVDGHLYEHENGWTDAGRPRIGSIFAETATMSDGGQAAIFRAQMDSGAGYDATQVRVTARQTHDGPDVSFGPYAPQSNGYTPMRAGGRDLRVRIEATKDRDWSIGKPTFDVQSVGNR